MNDAELLHELKTRLTYDRENGQLLKPSGRAIGCYRVFKPGSPGVVKATFLGHRYALARLIWLVETGEMPNGSVYRINPDPTDNRFENLYTDDCVPVFYGPHQRKPRVPQKAKADRFVQCLTHGAVRIGQRRSLERGCPQCALEAIRSTPEEKAAKARARNQLLNEKRKTCPVARRKQQDRVNAWIANKARVCPKFKAATVCRAQLQRVLRDTMGTKARERTEAILGYTYETFREHIQSQFAEWMTWANHGEWHVDHIVPVSWFVEKGITDPRVINALSNLRPLSAAENMAKSNALIDVL